MMQRMKAEQLPLCYRLLLMILFLALACLSIFSPGVSYAMKLGKMDMAASCTQAGSITSQSLLVVLLDRSSSLIGEPNPTDPNGYSTSVTKALADLWPGKMVVIPFSGNSTPVLGPAVLTDDTQRANLKMAIQSYPIGGSTPLSPAMHEALNQLKGAAPGSRVVIVTDGSPNPAAINGVNQADDIRQHLIGQFCAQGVPVSTIGLALDLSTPDGQLANQLLGDIATGTGGTYTLVRTAHELGKVIVKLYADWQHLVFAPTKYANGDYTISIDTYAKRVIFVTFRSDGTFNITLSAPDGQPLSNQSVRQSTDRHYEIDDMLLSTINQPGAYTINVSGDSGSQVYALVESRLHVVLRQPTTRTTAYIGKPLTIQAQLEQNGTPVIPKPNEATLIAHVTTQANGKPVSTDVELVQANNSALFSRQITLPGPAGQVHIQIEAVYLQAPVEASQAQVTIQLVKVPVVPPTPPCGTNINCYMQRYGVFIVGIPLALLLVFLLLFLFLRKGAKGWSLKQGSLNEDLGSMGRSPVISSRKLEGLGFTFCGEEFDLIFKQGGVRIRPKNETSRILVTSGRQAPIPVSRDGADLVSGDSIYAGNCPPATLYMMDDGN